MSCISFSSLCPASGDSENVLLAKILQSLNEGGGGGGAGVSSISVNGGPAETGAVSLTIPAGGVTSVNGDPGPAVALDSGEVPEGSNLYYTQGRFDTAFAAKSTTDLTEGTNLYFTEARVRGTDLAGFVAAPGTVTAADTVLSALEKLTGNAAAATLVNFTDETADADGVVWRNAGADEVFRTVGTSGFVQFMPVATSMRLHTVADTDSFTFLAGPDKAMGTFFEANGQAHATSPGTAIASIHDNGQFRIRSAPVSSTASRLILVQNGSNGFLGVGPIVTPTTLLHLNSNLTGQRALFEQASGDTSGFLLNILKNRGTLTSPSVVLTGDTLGTIAFSGRAGMGPGNAVAIQAVTTAAAGGTSVPTRLTFATVETVAIVNRLTIDSSVRVGLGPSVTPSANLDVNNSTTTTLSYFYSTTDGLATPVDYARIEIVPGASTNDAVIRTTAGGTGLAISVPGTPHILKVGSGQSVGTDIVAQSVVFRSGQSTGTGIRGDILFQQSAPGASGSALNPYTTSWTINTAGAFVATGGFPINAATITLTGGYLSTAVATLTDAATIATDASLANHFRVTLGGNRTLGNPTNPYDGARIVYEFIQDGAGSRTLAFDTKFLFGTDITGATLSTAAGTHDLMTVIYNLAMDRWLVVAFVKGYL